MAIINIGRKNINEISPKQGVEINAVSPQEFNSIRGIRGQIQKQLDELDIKLEASIENTMNQIDHIATQIDYINSNIDIINDRANKVIGNLTLISDFNSEPYAVVSSGSNLVERIIIWHQPLNNNLYYLIKVSGMKCKIGMEFKDGKFIRNKKFIKWLKKLFKKGDK